MHRLALLLLITACEGDEINHLPDGPTIDGAPSSTSCGNPAGGTATPTVMVSGVLGDSSFDGSSSPLADATVHAFRVGGASLGTTTSETSGIFQVVATTTNSLPVEYLEFSKAGYTTERYFPRAPFVKTTTIPRLGVFPPAQIAMFPTQYSIAQDPGKAMAIVFVTDCQSSPIAGATVSITPSAGTTVKYITDTGTGEVMTDALGIAVIFNVAPGSSVVAASAPQRAMHEHAIAIDAAGVALATISEQ